MSNENGWKIENEAARLLINEAGYAWSVTINPDGQDYLNTYLNGVVIHQKPFTGLPLTSTLVEWSFDYAWEHYHQEKNNAVMGVPQS